MTGDHVEHAPCALEARATAGDPIRVGLVGAGYAGRGFAARIIRRVPGIGDRGHRNRTVAEASGRTGEAGIEAPGPRRLGRRAPGRDAQQRPPVVTDDPTLLTDATDRAIVEATARWSSGPALRPRAIVAGKHLVLINAELGLVPRTDPQDPRRRGGASSSPTWPATSRR